MAEFFDAFFNVRIILRYLPDLLLGMAVTLGLAVALTILGLALGTALAMLRSYGFRLLNFFIVIFADVMRALPPLMVIVLLYFGLPYSGIRLNGAVVTVISLGLILAAFVEELVWAGIRALDKGQFEAARASGLQHGQALAHVIVPQAVRLVLPALISRLIIMIKATSLASVVAVPDLIAQASAALGFSSNASPLFAASIGYLVLLVPFVVWGRRIEARYKWGK
ncbi:amino acid ABC transporter permease [Mesorhizobium australicum]|uniref:Amino acid ABC transporter membrane protein 1, PAAT family n=1 Tax=Mesorhizobium australicum TaxID=536018 RepID=A0A1X7MUP7_9HYPH|nr:amino acid ABC transporter permease [Mesorhizobium australicum]SMH27746.1 amino acid ABC transporter membrane protein 1, PAAT family [Mesorhizobium australicum]